MDYLAGLTARMPEMVELLGALVSAESPSSDPALCRACLDVLASAGEGLLGAPPERVEVEGRSHLRWRLGGPTRVLLLTHLDTVWPAGTIERWPFSVEGDRATGPGVFDMKAGAVQALFAVAALPERAGVTLLATTDEEIGSPTSRGLIETEAAGAAGVLVMEPSAGGALKVARKGVAMYTVRVVGRAAHASVPDRGVNATLEAARRLLSIHGLGDAALGTTVTPTVIRGGTVRNTVPAQAEFLVDVRARTAAELARVDAQIRQVVAAPGAARLTLEGGPNRPPYESAAAGALLETARRIWAGMGLGHLDAIEAAGGSDGNFTAAMGVPTLDGLGAAGDGLHAEGEHVLVPAMPQRAALLAGLVAEVLGG